MPVAIIPSSPPVALAIASSSSLVPSVTCPLLAADSLRGRRSTLHLGTIPTSEQSAIVLINGVKCGQEPLTVGSHFKIATEPSIRAAVQPLISAVEPRNI